MLTIQGKTCRFCGGASRRSFLRIGALGSAVTLADILRLRATAADAPNRPAGTTNKAAILIYLPGGPSHMDTYDPKPSAPRELRGEFGPIRTRVSGIDICELMPRQAAIMDKLAIIRSVTGMTDEHFDTAVMTGWSEAQNSKLGRPSLGAVVSKLRDNRNTGIPPFVSLRGLTRGLEPGYLGIAHRAFTPSGPGMADLEPRASLSGERLRDRRALLQSFDQLRRDIDASGTIAGLDAFTERAFDIITSGAVRKALDITLEGPRVRDRYGEASDLLTARRLVEAGVGCVTVAVGADVETGSWDTHNQNFRALRRLLPVLDAGVSALVEDLYQRGLEKDVVVLTWGEFGRSPRINAQAGRDHWPPVMSCLIAGGGLRMGQVIGATNGRGEYAKEQPCGVQNVLATIYHALGIDPAMTFNDRSGRPIHLLEHREVVRGLL